MSLAWRQGAIVLLLCALAVAAPAALAQSPRRAPLDIYVVSSVAVDRPGASAAAARDAAIAEAHRQAFQRLVRRLVVANASDRVGVPAPARLADMVRDLEVADERASNVRYSARFGVRFKADAVRAFLKDLGVPFSETLSTPVLVLPVIEVAGKKALWDDANTWRDAWSAKLPRDGLVPLVLAPGDVQDVGSITAEQALAGDFKRLKAIMDRHGALEVVVAHAKLVPEGAVGAPEVQVDAVRHAGGPSQVSVERLRANPGEGAAAMLQRAVEVVAFQIEERWKRENAHGQAERVFEVSVPLRSLREWNEVRARLARVPAVKKSELIEISKTEARVRLVVSALDASLAAGMAQQDLQIEGQGVQRTLRLTGTAAAQIGTP